MHLDQLLEAASVHLRAGHVWEEIVAREARQQHQILHEAAEAKGGRAGLGVIVGP